MQFSDSMSRQVVTIGTSDSCLEAIVRMHQARVRHLPVVNGEGELVGVDHRGSEPSPGLASQFLGGRDA